MRRAENKDQLSFLNDPEQLSLSLPLDAASSRDDLVVSEANSKAVDLLESWPAWPSPISILAGPVGAGKTHLAKIWADKSKAQFLSMGKDDEAQMPEAGNIIVEDIEKGGFSETWLFHLFNSVKASGSNLLLTSRYWPGDWDISLPDLKSRMKTTTLMELNEPDDILLFGVLSKLFADRQIQVSPNVLEYLVVRMERSLAAAQVLVAEIDSQSLAQKRPVTRNLAADTLRNLGLQD